MMYPTAPRYRQNLDPAVDQQGYSDRVFSKYLNKCIALIPYPAHIHPGSTTYLL